MRDAVWVQDVVRLARGLSKVGAAEVEEPRPLVGLWLGLAATVLEQEVGNVKEAIRFTEVGLGKTLAGHAMVDGPQRRSGIRLASETREGALNCAGAVGFALNPGGATAVSNGVAVVCLASTVAGLALASAAGRSCPTLNPRDTKHSERVAGLVTA